MKIGKRRWSKSGLKPEESYEIFGHRFGKRTERRLQVVCLKHDIPHCEQIVRARFRQTEFAAVVVYIN